MFLSVHGGFSEWAEWGPCSVSCGVGNQKRLRKCNKPLPANGGRHCAGSDAETRSCQGKPCPGETETGPRTKCLQRRPCANVTRGTKSLVPPQWMVTGQNGLSGRSVHVRVVRATEPGCGPAAVLRLSMEAGRVRGRQRTWSCAGSGHVQVRKCICMRRHTHAGKLLNTICNS